MDYKYIREFHFMNKVIYNSTPLQSCIKYQTKTSFLKKYKIGLYIGFL